MTVKFRNADYSSEKLSKSVLNIIKETHLCSMATINPDGTSHINTAFFCFNEDLDVYFVSDWRTKHCRNLTQKPKVALTIFDSHQKWGDSLRGIQLFGEGFATDAEE